MVKEKVKSLEISITPSKGTFLIFRKPSSKKGYNLRRISELRQVLNKEKAKILSTIKNRGPSSIYELSKQLGRNFKSVSDDVKILKKFGFIELKREQTKKRRRLRPVLAIDTLNIKISL